ncbi:MAG: dGTP triphosphohydrolase [Vicinamibacterales bacterium]
MDWKILLNARRRRQSAIPKDHRGEFERDFDRAVFSTPVKRLQDKAQVFPLEPHDAVRTRLTHSLEVSSVARGLGRKAASWLLEKKKIGEPGMDRSIEAIAATCGLIHDLGNPPFGHAGEDAIRSWFQRRDIKTPLCKELASHELAQDFLKFEGNAQSLRLVAKLQILADYNGLNLTFGTLSALGKYVTPSHAADENAKNHAHRKPGYFASEADIVKQVRQETGTGDARNPICYLVEAADDIVYLAADVEDAIKKNVLSWNEVAEALGKSNERSVTEALRLQAEILKAGGEKVADDLDDDIKAAAFRTGAIKVMVDGAFEVFRTKYDAIMQGQYEGTLLSDSDAVALSNCLREIGKTRVYPTRSTLVLELMGRKVIGDLMDVFWEGAEAMPKETAPRTRTFPGKAAALFSPNYRKVFQHFVNEPSDLPEQYHRYQLVTDYICGMTDSFAKRLHTELFNGR